MAYAHPREPLFFKREPHKWYVQDEYHSNPTFALEIPKSAVPLHHQNLPTEKHRENKPLNHETMNTDYPTLPQLPSLDDLATKAGLNLLKYLVGHP